MCLIYFLFFCMFFLMVVRIIIIIKEIKGKLELRLLNEGKSFMSGF